MANIKSEKRSEIYSQLQSWSTVGIPSCIKQVGEPPVSNRVGKFPKTPRPRHPTLRYKVLQEPDPLPAQPITNLLMDACRLPRGMTTEPLKFPNLITGFDRNPLHAARAALYTRYIPYEWMQNQIRLSNEVDANRCYSEALRKDNARLMREADEKLQKRQMENDLEKRITFCRNELNEMTSELERLIEEDGKMQECRRGLQIAIQSLEQQIHIAQECLCHRESREGADLVRDEVESALLKEIETLRNYEKKLKQFTDSCVDRLTNDQTMQHQLQMSIRDKETALEIVCYKMNKFSQGLRHYDGREKYNLSVTETESCMKVANSVMKKSEAERAKSRQLRSDIDSSVNAVVYEIYEAWENTNKALNRRAIEILEAKEKLETHLQTIQKEILNIENSIKLMRKFIADQGSDLKVPDTQQLEERVHLKVELRKDQLRMIQDKKDINKIVYDMNLKLQQCEAQRQQLLRTKSNLECDLRSKMHALFIDREKCMGLRRSYPTLSTVEF